MARYPRTRCAEQAALDGIAIPRDHLMAVGMSVALAACSLGTSAAIITYALRAIGERVAAHQRTGGLAARPVVPEAAPATAPSMHPALDRYQTRLDRPKSSVVRFNNVLVGFHEGQ